MSPSRPRSVRDHLARSAGVTRPSDTTTPAAAGAAAKPASAAAEGSKFTVVLTPEDAATFDMLALQIRRQLGRRVIKGDLVRTLVALAADDAVLRDQVVNELRGKTR